MERDIKHLRILGTINYILAGFGALIFLFPLFYLSMAFLMIILSSLSLGLGWYAHGAPDFSTLTASKGREIPMIIFPLIIGFALGLPLLASTIATYYCGRSMREQKNYIFCMVMATLHTASLPFGTILGVFSLIVLLRDSVKPLFDRNG